MAAEHAAGHQQPDRYADHDGRNDQQRYRPDPGVAEGFHCRGEKLIQIDRDETIEITYRRRQGKRVRRVEVKADRPLDAVSSARESVRLIGEKGAAKVGYVHFWNVMSRGNIDVLEKALGNDFAKAEALAIDLRGRGGSVGIIAEIAEMLTKEKRPIALLIDREARSAKEMLAYYLKGSEHITLIGETTAGAVFHFCLA